MHCLNSETRSLRFLLFNYNYTYKYQSLTFFLFSCFPCKSSLCIFSGEKMLIINAICFVHIHAQVQVYSDTSGILILTLQRYQHTHTHTHTLTQPTQQRCMCVFVCACVGFHMTHRIKGVSEKQAIWRSRKRDLFFSCKMYRIPHYPCPISCYNLREQIGLGLMVTLYIITELDIMSSI